MTKRGRSALERGKRWERAVAKYLSWRLRITVSRTKAGRFHDRADLEGLVTIIPVIVDCKDWDEPWPLTSWINKGLSKVRPGESFMLVIKRPRQPVERAMTIIVTDLSQAAQLLEVDSE